MSDFCLPDSLKPGRAEPKVDKNRWKCLIFVYLTLRNRVARPRKWNKISKNRKNVLLGYLHQSGSVVSDYGQNVNF